MSSIAKEKLARIGELTEEERAKLKYSEQLTLLLAEYFTNKLSPDDLWKELRKHKDEGRGFLLKDTQLKLLDAMKLSSRDVDIDKLRRGLLAAETLKDNGDYAGLEHDLKSIEDLRRQYKEERGRVYNKIKDDVEKQVRLAAQRLAAQTAVQRSAIDVQGSVEASSKASSDWKNFVSKHDSTYAERFRDQITRIQEKLNV
ncbi:hypothetical protein ACFLT8_03095 [Chloroflexota bacterium]